MKLCKFFAVLFCLSMLLSAFTGCVREPAQTLEDASLQTETSTGGVGDSEDEENADTEPSFDFDAAYASHAPDTAMIIVGDYTVTWGEIFFLFHENLRLLKERNGSYPVFSEINTDGITYAESIIEYAIDNSLRFRAYEYGAALLEIPITGDKQQFLDNSIEDMLATVGGERVFLEMLWKNSGVKDRDLFEYLFYLDYLPYFIFMEVYGQFGEVLTDEDMARLTESDGYMLAKHIMRMKGTDGDTTPLRELEIVLRQLNTYVGDDFDEFFDTLMFENSEDAGGLYEYPDGYLFRLGDMEPPFDEVCNSLEIGEISGVVETGAGYHIIYRLPVNFDTTPIASAQQGESDTLRVLTAMELFEEDMLEWKAALNPVFTDAFRALDLSAIFVLR